MSDPMSAIAAAPAADAGVDSDPDTDVDTTADAPRDLPLRAAEVPIALSFEAGSVSLPLAQLASVRPGFVFELPHALGEGSIRVFANGVAVGSGELVRIGDVVGVRLTQLDAAAS